MRLLSLSFPSSSSWVFIILALTYHCCLAHKNTTDILCIERERVALLEFKQDLVDYANRLVSWGSEEDDCCKWVGILCNIFTGHVHEIHLRGPLLDPNYESLNSFSPWHPNYVSLRLRGKINPSLLVLEKLEYLDMSNNDFQGIRIPKFIGSLCNLRYLNLSYSSFSGEIPPQLGNLSRLHTLGLSSSLPNYALSSNLQWLSGLSMLQNLDMSYVDLSKASNWLQMINSLPSLVELNLSSCGLNNSSPGPIFSVNFSSLFLLDLSDNPDLSGIVFHNITSLRKLYVSSNPFMNIPMVLRRLSSVGSGLATLDISDCHLSSSTIGHLRNMTSLVVLDLSNNQLTKGIPKSLGNLCNLRQLRLSNNTFGEISLLEILKTFLDCNSSKLESLEVNECNVSGHLPKQLGELHNLVNLNLGLNLLSGPIPYSIGSLSSLRSLSLRDNQLNGNLPESIGQLCELETINVGGNVLMGMVTEGHFANLTKLKELWAGNKGITLKLHSTNWVPPFQLKILELNSWNLGPQFPLWLQSQTRLIFLDISNTRISDNMPNWFWSRLSNLRHVQISFNQIQGSISKIPAPLIYLDLSSNNFSGPLPKVSDNSTIRYLDLSSNSFFGSLKPLLCPKMEPSLTLGYLNLSNNHLSQVIPQSWKNWQGLSILDFENNNLSGEIPSSLGYLFHLELLNVSNNTLIGTFPVSLMNLTSLKILQLSQNELMGNIPSWLGREFKHLKVLELRSNRFSGDIPFELCHLISLQVLDLAHNNLSGDIPTCFSDFRGMSRKEVIETQIYLNFDIRYTSSATITVRGREDRYSSTLGLVTMLDLSNNNFSGPIPSELMSLIELRSMSLSGNYLTGRIPEKIGELKTLEYLDLSLNQLHGEIPLSLSNLNFLARLNLSYNNLIGRIPPSTQIQGFDNSSFIGNKLCGPPLTGGCGVQMPNDDDYGQGMKQGNNTAHEMDWGFVISILLGFAVGFWVVVGPLIVSRLWRITYFRILNKVMYGI